MVESNLLTKSVDINLRGIIYIRDALSFYLTDVRLRHNNYNILIIVISLFTALFESLKAELGWLNEGHILSSFSTLFPIFLATLTGFISSMLKFERLADKIEETTKAIEKCHNSVHRHREVLQMIYNSQTIKPELLTEICNGFREAILSAEIVWLSRMDPITKNYYLLQSSMLHDRFLLSHGDDENELLTLIRESFIPIEKNRFKINMKITCLQKFCGAVYCCFRKPNVAEQGCQTNNYSISHHEDNKIDDIELGCQTNNDSISHHEDNNHDLHGGWDNTDEATDTNC
tara:strand:- start:2143 stop:3006 length:864 start_codon:yes stop_codon:yes gene_type:complete